MAEQFLRSLYPSSAQLDGDFISLWIKASKLSVHAPATVISEIAECALSLDAEDQEIYYGPALRSRDCGSASRGTKADIAALPGIWLDVDLKGPAHKAENLPADLDDALAILATLPEPTITVDSGHGLHFYWLTTELIRDVALGARLLEALQKKAVTSAAARGWHVDMTADTPRILRLPGTTNRKSEPRPVLLLDDQGPRYSIEELSQFLLTSDTRLTASERVGHAPNAGATAGGKSALSPPAVRAPKPINDVRAAMRAHKDEEVRLAEKGESFAKSGDRDSALQRVCSKVAFIDPGGHAEELAELLRASLGVWALEPAALLSLEQELAKACEKISRAQQEILQKLGNEETERQAFTAALFPEKQQALDDFSEYAAARGRSPAQLAQELVIQHESAYYVFVDGAYKSPLGQEALKHSIVRDLASAPVEWWKLNSKGEKVLKKPQEVIVSCCTVARGAQADLALQTSWYDPEQQVFHEAACPLRKLPAREHAEVGRWLQKLVSPAELELLLDWIALLPDLDRQAPALYLVGPKSSGKTLLAHGLARLWTEGPPGDAARVLDDFNDELTRCPLVLADEHLPQKFAHERLSAKIRSLIGSGSRTLNRKFMPTAALRGAARLMLCANNADLLNFGDEDIGQDDIQALSLRFLHLTVLDSAVEYLDKLGGPPVLNMWIEHDMLAEHALWIRSQRPEASMSKNRFGIESPITDMHRALALQSKSGSLVGQWLVGFLNNPKPQIVKAGGVYAVGGHFYVNANSVLQWWTSYLEGHQTLTLDRIGKLLTKLASGPERRINGVRCRDLNVETLLQLARRIGLDDEKMRTFINRPGQIRADGGIQDTFATEA